MKNIEFSHFVNLQSSMLKYINPKIANHQEEVAYITYRICRKLGYDSKKTIELIIASLLHDIGSFKIGNVDELTKFNMINTLSHAIYGYLLLDKCENFNHISEIDLYHNHYYNEKNKSIPGMEFKEESSLVLISDRIAVLLDTTDYDKDNILCTLQNYSEAIFNPKYTKVIYELIENGDLLKQLKTKKYKKELHNILKISNIPSFDAKSQLIIFPLIIDFFSDKIAMHTIKFYAVSKFICEYLVLDEDTTNDISIVTFLHDLGKLCMQKEIWRYNYSFDNYEKHIIENQLFYTENILRDSGIHQDIVDLACINYENLSGFKNKYYSKLNLNSIEVKILLVAHTFAELIETIDDKDELFDMFVNIVDEYDLDLDISNILINNYEDNLEYVYKQENKYNKIFDEINEEASYIFEKFE